MWWQEVSGTSYIDTEDLTEHPNLRPGRQAAIISHNQCNLRLGLSPAKSKHVKAMTLFRRPAAKSDLQPAHSLNTSLLSTRRRPTLHMSCSPETLSLLGLCLPELALLPPKR